MQKKDWTALLNRYYRWKDKRMLDTGVREPSDRDAEVHLLDETDEMARRMQQSNRDRKARLVRCRTRIVRLKVLSRFREFVRIRLLLEQTRIVEVKHQCYRQQDLLPCDVVLAEKEDGWKVLEERPFHPRDKRTVNLDSVFTKPVSAMSADSGASSSPDFSSDTRQNYNRAKAVQYADKWWNSHNPEFLAFEVDCTNYVSQCLYAGGIPMHDTGNRSTGWWYRYPGQDKALWSFSWAVAHSLRWYLASQPANGIRAEEVASADQLMAGDIICYDFDGDGHWQHNTIVVAKDGNGMPLVNAHTANARHRYWDYHDSYAWTDRIRYKFFHILS
ncbi:MAG: amidase domain-containing protein [Bacillaceae bacterium]|nr:amidase domain-containing protein [Bacillaceae bacterium]